MVDDPEPGARHVEMLLHLRSRKGGDGYDEVRGGGSYLSSHDPREILGLGVAAKIDLIEIHWPAPSTAVDKLTNVNPNRYIHVVEGKGIVESDDSLAQKPSGQRNS